MSKNEIFKDFRLAHTMLRVLDLEASLKFYCDILGMNILRRTDYPEGRFTNTFIAVSYTHLTLPTILLV